MKRALTALSAALSMLVAPGSSLTASSPPDSEGAPRSGGTLTMLVHFELRSLDPVAMITSGSSDAGGQRGFPIFGALVLQDANSQEIQPHIAESLTSTDAVVWTLRLRPDVEFSDGTPYDAAAVKFNWERHQHPANLSRQLVHAEQIDSMEVVDPLTLEITLTEPNGQFPQTIAQTALTFIGSPTAIQELGDQFGSSPVGAGPFLLDEWIRDSQITFVRNPSYWNQPMPYVDELVVRTITGGNQRRESIIAGDADLALLSTWTDVDAVTQAGLQVEQWVSNFGSAFWLNNTRPPFDDVRVRRAIALGVSLERYSETVEQGLSPVPTTYFREGSPFYEPTIELPAYDPAEAQRLFSEVAAETGTPVGFTVTHDTGRAADAEFMQAELAQYDDVEVAVESLDLTAYIPKVLGERDYDMAFGAFNITDPEPSLYQFFYSTSPANALGYASPEMDAALDAGRVSQDPDARAEAYRTVQEIFLRDQPAFYVAPYVLATAATDSVRGLEIYGDGAQLFDRIWLAD